jgi:phage terminase large subunit-like protein
VSDNVNYVKEYLDEIHKGNEIVGIKIKTLYERECSWMDDPPKDFPFYFDEDAGQRPIDFIEKFCKHSKGRWGGKPFKLELFQKAKIQLVFGWLEKCNSKRRFREVVDIRGRKCGKSSETAAVELYCLMADGEAGAEIYCTANKLDQSKLIFNEAVNMRAQSPQLKSMTKKRQSDIYFPATFSKLQALAAETRTLDGLNSSMFSLDEFHEARDSKVYDVMVQSQAAREQPLAWLISTNGYVREMFFDDKYNYCSKVALWEQGFEDYRLLPLLYELDERDEWDKPDCWGKANPGLGKIKSLTTLADNVEKAKRDPSFLPTVMVKDFNVPENTNAAWLSYEAAVNETVVPMEYLEHSYAVAGCDLSAVRDLTAATLLIRRPNDQNFYVLQKCFLPESRVNEVEASSSREAPYKLWAANGWLHICDGATVDFHAVTQWFVDMVEKYDIRPLFGGYDAALSGYWIEEMRDYGFDFEKIRQGPFTWSYPFKQLAGLFEEHKIISNNSPMLRWAVLNTGVKMTNADGIQSMQPVKTGTTKRIDPLVSLLNAFTCYCNHEDEYLRYVR